MWAADYTSSLLDDSTFSLLNVIGSTFENRVLHKLSTKTQVPHLIVFGAAGIGKGLRIRLFLRSMFGPQSLKLKFVPLVEIEVSEKAPAPERSVKPKRKKGSTSGAPGSASEKKEGQPPPHPPPILQQQAPIYEGCCMMVSSVHCEINVEQLPRNRQEELLIKVIKDRCSTIPVSAPVTTGSKRFQVMVLWNAHHLKKQSQKSICQLIEENVERLRIIFHSHSDLSLIPAIRSRCLGLPLQSLTEQEVTLILVDVCKRRHLTAPKDFLSNVAKRFSWFSHVGFAISALELAFQEAETAPAGEDGDEPMLSLEQIYHYWEVDLKKLVALLSVKSINPIYWLGMAMELIQKILIQNVTLSLALTFLFHALVEAKPQDSSFYIDTFVQFHKDQIDYRDHKGGTKDLVVASYPWPAVQKLFLSVLLRVPFKE